MRNFIKNQVVSLKTLIRCVMINSKLSLHNTLKSFLLNKKPQDKKKEFQCCTLTIFFSWHLKVHGACLYSEKCFARRHFFSFAFNETTALWITLLVLLKRFVRRSNHICYTGCLKKCIHVIAAPMLIKSLSWWAEISFSVWNTNGNARKNDFFFLIKWHKKI